MNNRKPADETANALPYANFQDESAQEETLRAVLPSLYAADAATPDHLRARIRALAAQDAQQLVMTPVRGWRVLRLLALSGAFSLALAAVFAWPHISAAMTLRRIQNAISDAHIVGFSTWKFDDDGKSVNNSNGWYRNGQWRIDSDKSRHVEVCTDGKRYIYNKRLNTVTIENATRPIGYESISGFSLNAVMQDRTRLGLNTRLEKVDEYEVGAGKRVLYKLNSDLYPREHQFIEVDPRTDLPIRCLSYRNQNNEERISQITTFSFNLPDSIAAAQFSTRFPGARVLDIEAGREMWRKRLENVVQRKRGGSSIVSIRDFRVNSAGDVFLLYTAGFQPTQDCLDLKLTLTDDLGNMYLRCERYPFRPTITEGDGRVNGFMYGGNTLQGAFWIPLLPETEAHKAWKARKFTLIVQDASAPQDQMPMQFTFRVGQADAQLVPAYMPYMALRPGSLYPEWAIREAEAWERARYYKEDAHNMAAALTWLEADRAVDAAWSEAIGSQISDFDVLMDQYEVLSAMGRHAEARDALRKANTRPIYSTTQLTWIEARLQREGMK